MQSNYTPIDIPRILYETLGSDDNEGPTRQCDCACVASSSLNQQTTILSTNIPYSLDSSNFFGTIPLIANYYTMLGQDSNSIVLNHSAFTMANHFSQPHLLTDVPPTWREAWGDKVIQSTLEQMVRLGLLIPEGYPAPTLTEVPTTLSAWLHLTDRCNLRCSYCYLPHNSLDMPVEIGHDAINATFRSALVHGYRQVKLKYAGGEALLRFPFIAELHHHARILVDQHGLALEEIILSNGTLLTTGIAEVMRSLGLRLMISLDGLEDFHDCQRHYANGQGSFADVKQAIELALARHLIPDISITVSAHNAEGLPGLIEWILVHDLPFSLNFYRENDYSVISEDLSFVEEQIIFGMLAAFKVIEAYLPRRSLLASLVDRANLAAPHLRTCSVANGYLVFDYLGQIHKCQMQMNNPVTTAKADDPLTLLHADEIGIQNISVDEKEDCQDCRWKYWCTGGCPLATYRTTGRYDVKSPYCNIYKALYPEAVRLEGLRLLKYANELEI